MSEINTNLPGNYPQPQPGPAPAKTETSQGTPSSSADTGVAGAKDGYSPFSTPKTSAPVMMAESGKAELNVAEIINDSKEAMFKSIMDMMDKALESAHKLLEDTKRWIKHVFLPKKAVEQKMDAEKQINMASQQREQLQKQIQQDVVNQEKGTTTHPV